MHSFKMPSKDIVLILDFGSQYTQLIARRVRENKVFSQIVPYNIPAKDIIKLNAKGLIFSGGPASVYERKSPLPDKKIFKLGKEIERWNFNYSEDGINSHLSRVI